MICAFFSTSDFHHCSSVTCVVRVVSWVSWWSLQMGVGVNVPLPCLSTKITKRQQRNIWYDRCLWSTLNSATSENIPTDLRREEISQPLFMALSENLGKSPNPLAYHSLSSFLEVRHPALWAYSTSVWRSCSRLRSSRDCCTSCQVRWEGRSRVSFLVRRNHLADVCPTPLYCR